MEERDWRKDWEMCERTTPGPWRWDWDGICAPPYGSLFALDRKEVIDLSCDDCGGRRVEQEADRVFILQRVKELKERLRALEERRCETCKWWFELYGGWGSCRRVDDWDWPGVADDPDCLFTAHGHPAGPAGLSTRPSFGCVRWERKEDRES